MTTCAPKPQLSPLFTPRQQALIEQIFSTKISELIASGGLVCLHCCNSSSNSNSSQVPWLRNDSKVSVPTTPLQQPATKLQQLIDNRSDIGPNTSCPSANGVAANLSTPAIICDKLASVDKRLTDLEHRVMKFESSMIQTSNQNPNNSESVDSTRLLDRGHAKFETTMSKLQSASQQITNNQRYLESTDCKNNKVESSSDSSSNVALEQSDVINLTVVQSVAIDRHEILGTLVLNIGHEHNELAEFVRQLSECTASADDVVELKAVVECMAKVTGLSEQKAEQLITEFIGRTGVELEHLKREQRSANDKLRELLLAKDQMTDMYDSPYQNPIPYLNLVTETMRGECKRYKRDLDAMARRLSERVNAKVAQAMKQSLADKNQQSNKAQFGLPLTEDQNAISQLPILTHSSSKMLTDMSQPVANDGGTFMKAAAKATVGLNDEPGLIRQQNTKTEVKNTAISSLPPSAEITAQTSLKRTRLQQEEQLSNLTEPGMRVQHETNTSLMQLDPDLQTSQSDSKSFLNCLAHGSRRLMSDRRNRFPVFTCVVVGHESVQTHKLIQAYVHKMSGSCVTHVEDQASVNVRVPVKDGAVYNLHLTNCIDAEKLMSLNDCDIIIICYSIINKVSCKDIRNVWLKKIRHVFPNTPYLLVGTRLDKQRKYSIRNFQEDYEQGFELSREIGAVAYLECSDLDVDNVEAVFMYALEYILKNAI